MYIVGDASDHVLQLQLTRNPIVISKDDGCLIKVSEIPKQVELYWHSAVHYNNQIILFGGRNMNGENENKVRIFDLAS